MSRAGIVRSSPTASCAAAAFEEYRGLDLPRADWPATKLTSGARFTLTYRTSIPHEGTFELYLTTDGYDPTRPLTWSRMSSKPFLTVTDPPVTGGAYHLAGRLPPGRTGRQILYTVWRNTSTTDTYYSCSDVVLSGGGAARTQSPTAAASAGAAVKATPTSAAPSAGSATPTAPASSASASAASSAPVSAPASAGPSVQPVSASGTDDHARLLAAAAGAAVLGGAVAALTLRRRRRHG